ncbi:hypothetical protein ABLT93_07065 [Acinetobacter soli]|uniref:hypothetical protein n=1 Tax=Acinetobacter soli TaxID=487316 RepID=UPI001D176A27|nr:hypothetical protein [Acinetobacter soli]
MNNIAFFDFDGTITSTDSYTPFIFQTIPASRMKKGKFLLAPYILGYRLKLIRGTYYAQKFSSSALQGLMQTNFSKKDSALAKAICHRLSVHRH